MKIDKKNIKIYLAGHTGMVGSAILRILKKKKYKRIYFENSKKLNLIDQKKTYDYLLKIKPDVVIIAAAKVGGIFANMSQKANFLYENMMIQNNIIHSAYRVGVKKLILLGSSCIYPKFSKQPIKEKYLLTSSLEETNDAYAIAKISGVKMCENYSKQYNLNYISLMPTNLYGPGDNYNSKYSHFFPALIKKVYLAIKNNKKEITLWGNGKPKRELMYVDDLANACEFFVKKNCKHSIINIGTGKEKKVIDYAKFILKKLNYKLKIKFDKKKPNGTPRKLLDSSLARSYGWKPKFDLDKGFKLTYKNFIEKESKNNYLK